MLDIIKILNENLHWFAYVLVLFGILDLILTFLIRSHKTQISNTYIDLHTRVGFLPTSIIKVFLIAVLIYLTLHPPGNAGALVFLIVVYSLVVFHLLFDFALAFKKHEK